MDNAQDSTISSSNSQNVTIPHIEVNDSLTGNLDQSRTSQHTVQPGAITARLAIPNPGKPTAILVGSQYFHAITTNELNAFNFFVKFLHGQKFIPNVLGYYSDTAFTITTGNIVRGTMPYSWHNPLISYFGLGPPNYIYIESVDSLYITVHVIDYGSPGLSYFLTHQNMYFKFYCFNYDS